MDIKTSLIVVGLVLATLLLLAIMAAGLVAGFDDWRSERARRGTGGGGSSLSGESAESGSSGGDGGGE
ncbi:hypothetical protein IU510_14835 [Nocardia cyriacigeorgica]|uniref:hypothetical protein n=1 Tax=Nocardia cyriacigeorgica TaxID=135487 RepID=UPI001893A311|nr:hypothetical protein [Nocardia cyriacigeorgica]MBF6099354.1 hypothetical protein [Nocardia cyriacigeorgica]